MHTAQTDSHSRYKVALEMCTNGHIGISNGQLQLHRAGCRLCLGICSALGSGRRESGPAKLSCAIFCAIHLVFASFSLPNGAANGAMHASTHDKCMNQFRFANVARDGRNSIAIACEMGVHLVDAPGM